MRNDAMLVIEVNEWLRPGSEADVRLYPAVPGYWQGIREGQRIKMHEGYRVVGEATIIRFIRPTSSELVAAKSRLPFA